MSDTIHLKKFLLISVIFSLVISAVISVIIFLAFQFGEIELRILFTTISIGGYSLVGLFFAHIYEKNNHPYIGVAGLAFILFSFISTILLIWEANSHFVLNVFTFGWHFVLAIFFYWLFFIKKSLKLFAGGGFFLIFLSFLIRSLHIWNLIDEVIYVKIGLIILVVGASLLHISLILLAKSSKELIINISIYFTTLMILFVACMLIVLIFTLNTSIDIPEAFFRILGAFAILDGLGSIVTPILVKVMKIHRGQ